MRTLIASAVSLLLGLVMGWYFEHRHAEREATEIVEQFIEGNESKDAEEALRDVLAIDYIESGDIHNGAQLLSRAVVGFYSDYAHLSHNRKQTTDVLARIDQFASTNKFMADEIHKKVE